MRQSCQSCRWWRPTGHITEWPMAGYGQCRKGSPQMIEGSNQALWPIVQADDYCGEYTHDPDKWKLPEGRLAE